MTSTCKIFTLLTVSLIQLAGCKAGTFDPYPKHSEEPYVPTKSRKSDTSKFKGGIFKPPPGIKATPTTSIVQQSVMK